MLRMLRAALATVVVTFCMWPVSPAAADTDICNVLIIDETSNQVLDTAAIEEASAELENLGADVRIRAFDVAPLGNLDSYRDEQMNSCSSWRSASGDLKDNLLVFAFSLDRESAIYYGGNFEQSLQSEVDRIRNDHMNAHFRADDFTRGITAAEEESARMIEAHLYPSNETSESGGGSDFGPAAIIFAWIFGAIVAFVILCIVIRVLWQWRQRVLARRLEREKAKVAATKAHDNCDVYAAKWDLSHDTLARSVQLLQGQLPSDDAEELQTLLDAAESAHATAVTQHSDIQHKGMNFDPSRPHDTERYCEIARLYGEAGSQYETALANLDRLDRLTAKLQRDIEQAPVILAELEDSHEAADARCDSLIDEGYRVDRTEVDAALLELNEAQRHIEGRRPGNALTHLDKAHQLLSSKAAQLDALVRRHSDLQRDLDSLADVYSGAADSLRVAKIGLTSFEEQDHPSCREGLADKVDPLDEVLAEMRHNMADAKACVSMERQDWDEAERLIRQVRSLAERVRSDSAVVTERWAKLEALLVSLPEQLSKIKQRIGAHLRKIRTLKGSQENYERTLEACLTEVTQLQSELADEMPEYFALEGKVADLAKRVSSAVSRSNDADNAVKRKLRRKKEEEDRKRRAARRRRSSSYGSSSSGLGLGSSFGGSSGFGSSGGSSDSWGSGSSGGSSDGWGGGSSGGSSGGW